MKKLVFTLFALVLTASVFAQVSGGLKAGLNLASQKYKIDSESESYNGTGFHVGGYVNFGLTESLSLQPELLYNSLKISDDGDDLTMNYISIPVMFKYGFADNKFNIQAGPQLGLLMSTDPSEYKDEDGIKGTDFTFNLGAGADLGKFNITARYGIGLANVAGDAFEGLDLSIKNSNLQLSLGYTLFGGE
jgi:hypothetical protein